MTEEEAPHLADELWLRILSQLDPKTIWTSVRHVNKQLLGCSESHMTSLSVSVLPRFSVGIAISLGSGSRHHWYDIRATITFTFQRMHPTLPRLATFGSCLVMPNQCYEVAMKQWNHVVAAGGIGTKQEWKLQEGLDSVKKAKLKTLVVVGVPGAAAVSCDWRELLSVYYAD